MDGMAENLKRGVEDFVALSKADQSCCMVKQLCMVSFMSFF